MKEGVIMTELKPCPFCGSNNVKLTSGKNVPWITKDYQSNIRVVVCKNCGCMGGIFNLLALTKEKAEICAIKSWNKRGIKNED